MALKTFRERSAFLVGIISIVGIAAATTFAFYIDKLPFLKQVYRISAEFKDAAGLNPDNQVRVAGIKVGTVTGIRLEGDHVVVDMEIANDIEIPKDTVANIKLATILGTKFVDIDGEGGEPYLEDGDTIPLEDTTVPYEIYQAANQGTEVLEDLNGPLLEKLIVQLTRLTRTAKDEIGEALSGLNELGAALSANQSDLRSLLTQAKDLTDLLAVEGDEVVRLIDASNTVLASLATKREQLQSLLESTRFMAAEATSLLRDNRGEIDSILAKLHDALVVLERNVEHLDVALEYAGPSSRYFGSIFQQGPWGDIYVCALVLSETCEQDEE